MKKVFCMGFLLFATTLSFSATTGKTDSVTKGLDFSFPTTTNDIPYPVKGCSRPPQFCPDPPPVH